MLLSMKMFAGLCFAGVAVFASCQMSRIELRADNVQNFASLVLLRQEHYLERTPLSLVWNINTRLQSVLYETQRRIFTYAKTNAAIVITEPSPLHSRARRKIGYPADQRYTAKWKSNATLRLVRPEGKMVESGDSEKNPDINEEYGFIVLCFESAEAKKVIEVGVVEGQEVFWALPEELNAYWRGLGLRQGERFSHVEAWGTHRVGINLFVRLHLYVLNLHLFARFYDAAGNLVYEYRDSIADLPLFKQQEINAINYELITIELVRRMLEKLELLKEDPSKPEKIDDERSLFIG